MAYQFHLEKFEGPLDLLLSLIEKEKLDITQVSLAQVADQYLTYIREEQEISLANLSAFLTVAARLILIKSRALLPILDFSDDEEAAMEDLEQHLKAYQVFRTAAHKLGTLMRTAKPIYTRPSFLGIQVAFYPPTGISKEALREHFVDVLGGIPVLEVLPEKEIASLITIEEKITLLQRTLAERAESSFHELIENAADRVEVIVSFLAMLELIKQRYIRVQQATHFEHMQITRIV